MNKNSIPQNLILYIGNDHSYWEILQEKFKFLYPNLNYSFKCFTNTPKHKIKNLIKKIVQKQYAVIFIDYSLNAPEMLRLGVAIKQNDHCTPPLVVGLLESIHSKRHLTQSLTLGIFLNFEKGLETSNVIYNVITTHFNDKSKKADLACANIKFNALATTYIPIGYFTPQYIHIESNFKFKESSEIKLISAFSYEVPLTHNYHIKSSSDKNLYTHMNYSYDLEYNHLDYSEVEKTQDNIKKIQDRLKKDPKNRDLKYDLDELTPQVNSLIKTTQHDAQQRDTDFREWVTNSQIISRPKRTKIIVIDKDLSLINEIKDHIDNFPFSIRFQSQYDDELNNIYRNNPSIIVFQLNDPENKKTKETDKNSLDGFNYFIKKLLSLDNIRPFIFVTNLKNLSDIDKNKIGYDKILTYNDSIGLNLIKTIAKTYQENTGLLIPDDNKKKIFLSKYDPKAIGLLRFNLKILTISEIDLTFELPEKIPAYTNFYVKYPVKMSITTIPAPYHIKQNLLTNGHYAVIHGLGETEIRDLRKFINTLFFKDKKEED